MKGHHKICRIYSDHEIMRHKMEVVHCLMYQTIRTHQLSIRLKRQKVKRSVYRRRLPAYRDSLVYGTCKHCHEYIGEYPDHLNVKSRK